MFYFKKRQPPPLFVNLETSARDVFGQRHQFDLSPNNTPTSASTRDQDSLSALINLDSDKFVGSLATKQTSRIEDYSFTTTKTYNTNHDVVAGLSLYNNVANGVKVAVDILSSHMGCWASRVKCEFLGDACSLNGEIGAGRAMVAGVGSYRGWLAGCQVSCNPKQAEALSGRLALAYATDNFTVNTHLFHVSGKICDEQGIGGSLYQRVCPGLEAGVHVAWSAMTAEGNAGVGLKYEVGTATTVRASLRHSGHVGLGFQRNIGGGKVISVSAVIDASDFYKGHHKLAFGFEVHK